MSKLNPKWCSFLFAILCAVVYVLGWTVLWPAYIRSVDKPSPYRAGLDSLSISVEYAHQGDRVYLIRDNLTHARCYAITTDLPDVNGYAISCLPQK